MTINVPQLAQPTSLPSFKSLRVLALAGALVLGGAAISETYAGGGGTAGGGSVGGTSSQPSRVDGPTDTDQYKDAVKLINQDKYAEAIELLRPLNSSSPGDADVLNYMGYSYRQLGKYEVALGYYNQALEAEPKHRGANEYLGELYLQTGELEKAEAQLERLDDICTFGCSEYRELKAKIEEYKAGESAS